LEEKIFLCPEFFQAIPKNMFYKENFRGAVGVGYKI
jgi:hypothetical protein